MLLEKKRVLLIFIFPAFIVATPIFAANAESPADPAGPIRVRPTAVQVRQDRIYNLQQNKATRRNTTRATREATLEKRRNDLRARQRSRQATREARRDERRTRIEAKRASIAARIKEKRAAFKERLAEIKDKRKQAILERLDKRYGHINERWTNHFLRVLDRLSRILDKLETRTREAENKGVNTTGVPEALSAARSAIADSRATIENQAAKEYTIEIGDESTLRDDAQAVHDALRADLGAARGSVQAARESVRAAFQALKEAVVSHAKTNKPVQPAESSAGSDLE